MSIISDALKKVEGNSNASPAVREDPPESTTAGEERAVAGFAPAPSPPLFSVWSIVLSTAMVLIAAALLLVTWYTNRGRTISPATGSSTFAEVPAIDATLSAPAPPAPPAPVEMVEAPPPTVAEAPPAPTNPRIVAARMFTSQRYKP